jgi:hypothetical protein
LTLPIAVLQPVSSLPEERGEAVTREILTETSGFAFVGEVPQRLHAGRSGDVVAGPGLEVVQGSGGESGRFTVEEDRFTLVTVVEVEAVAVGAPQRFRLDSFSGFSYPAFGIVPVVGSGGGHRVGSVPMAATPTAWQFVAPPANVTEWPAAPTITQSMAHERFSVKTSPPFST